MKVLFAGYGFPVGTAGQGWFEPHPQGWCGRCVQEADGPGRPDTVEAHQVTTPDKTTANGAPIVDTTSVYGDATLYDSTLAGMTADPHKRFCDYGNSNPGSAARGQ